MAIETGFDVSFVAKLTSEEKQIQQNYRPVIGVHKWFARRPGALFRSLLLAEFMPGTPLSESYYRPQSLLNRTIADPFMGGGTTLFEANRVGCNVVGADINPMAFWIVRQELIGINRQAFRQAAEAVIADVERQVASLYETGCVLCHQDAPVKYFLWVKQQRCGRCRNDLDLFPGFLIAGNARHPNFVLHCPGCRHLVEVPKLPEREDPCSCPNCCSLFVWSRGTASRNRYTCPTCGHEGRYPAELRTEGPPRHRLIGMEYHCEHCRASHRGRFFKTAGAKDRSRVARAAALLSQQAELELPEDEIPDGDETKRLHRWGYQRYREMFNARQLLTLGLLLRRIKGLGEPETRHALSTVFSDSLRYQNMLCRYDSYALKCQDIFSVHGFPVGLIQCENNVLGIPRIGSGSFCHFVEKYDRAKAYCEKPFETLKRKRGKRIISTSPERIEVTLVSEAGELQGLRRGLLAATSLERVAFPREALDAVMTDPPYFDNVQYAELMDFCYAWLRLLLAGEFAEFKAGTTRSAGELTGNTTTGKGLEHFTDGLSRVFRHAAEGLKPGAPFVFTYHHNDLEAYVPVVVAILDAGLQCTATLPCPAEMTASLHINGTGSSVVDTIIVCRAEVEESPWPEESPEALRDWLIADRDALARGGVVCTRGDLHCLALGHLCRMGVRRLGKTWETSRAAADKMRAVEECLRRLFQQFCVERVIQELAGMPAVQSHPGSKPLQASLFDEVGYGF